MSLFTPAPRHGQHPGNDSAESHITQGLDDFLEQQSRWWREWFEAGNLWTSWWLSQLPPMGWPPGQVAPVADKQTPAATSQPGTPAVGVTVAEAAALSKSATRRPSGARSRKLP